MDSVIQIPNLFHEVEKYGQSAVAITDHGSIAGWYDFQTVGHDSPIKPIFGCEFYCKPTLNKPSDSTKYHLVVLAKNNDGLVKIRKLQRISVQHKYYKPLLPYPVLFENPEDLFISTACSLGSVGQSLDPSNKKHRPEEAEKFINTLFDVFGRDNVACEFQFHPKYVKSNVNIQNVINEKLLKLCDVLDPKYMIATCDSHFLNEADRDRRRQLQADGYKKQKKDVNPSLPSNCLGSRTLVEIFARESNFSYLDSVDNMIKDTQKVAKILNAEMPLNYGKVIPKFNKHKELKLNFMKGRKQVIK
jgi:DNA polymerase-3 subunit alpha